MEFITRSKPMTREALKLLLDLIGESGDRILNKNCKATNNKIKEEAWTHIKNVFDANGHGYSLDQIKLKWDNLKKVARKRATKIYENKKNDVGKEYIRPDEILDRVIGLMAREGPRVAVKDEQDGNSDKLARVAVEEVPNGDDPLMDDDYDSGPSDYSHDRPGPSGKHTNSPKVQNDTHGSTTSLVTLKKGCASVIQCPGYRAPVPCLIDQCCGYGYRLRTLVIGYLGAVNAIAMLAFGVVMMGKGNLPWEETYQVQIHMLIVLVFNIILVIGSHTVG